MNYWRSVRRFALVLPPLALFISALFMLASSPAAWGAGEHVGLDDWMPTVSGLVFALPGLVIGGLCLRRILKLTREDFDSTLFQLWFGLLLFTVSVGAELVLATRLGNSATYNSLRDASGDVTVSPEAFLTTTLVVTGLVAGMVTAAAYTYSEAITSNTRRFERKQGEVDGVGEILRGRGP